MSNIINYQLPIIIILVLVFVMHRLFGALKKNNLLLDEIMKNLNKVFFENAEQDFFNSERAEKMFEKDEISRLTDYCERFIEENPNSVHANWYCALAHYNKGDYELARNYFEKVININPLWKEASVIYLQEIANKTGLPESLSVH